MSRSRRQRATYGARRRVVSTLRGWVHKGEVPVVPILAFDRPGSAGVMYAAPAPPTVLRQYRAAEVALRELRLHHAIGSDIEQPVLEEMVRLWWLLADDDREALDREGPTCFPSRCHAGAAHASAVERGAAGALCDPCFAAVERILARLAKNLGPSR